MRVSWGSVEGQWGGDCAAATLKPLCWCAVCIEPKKHDCCVLKFYLVHYNTNPSYAVTPLTSRVATRTCESHNSSISMTYILASTPCERTQTLSRSIHACASSFTCKYRHAMTSYALLLHHNTAFEALESPPKRKCLNEHKGNCPHLR